MQAAAQKWTDIRLSLEIRIRQLVCKQKLIPVIPLCYTVTDSRFRLPADISVRRVEIIESRINKGVRHTSELIIVHLTAIHRQPHAAESKIPVYLREEFTVLQLVHPFLLPGRSLCLCQLPTLICFLYIEF